MSEGLLKTLGKFSDFQAEYEGFDSLSPTPSSFSDLVQVLDLILTTVGC